MRDTTKRVDKTYCEFLAGNSKLSCVNGGSSRDIVDILERECVVGYVILAGRREWDRKGVNGMDEASAREK